MDLGRHELLRSCLVAVASGTSDFSTAFGFVSCLGRASLHVPYSEKAYCAGHSATICSPSGAHKGVGKSQESESFPGYICLGCDLHMQPFSLFLQVREEDCSGMERRSGKDIFSGRCPQPHVYFTLVILPATPLTQRLEGSFVNFPVSTWWDPAGRTHESIETSKTADTGLFLSCQAPCTLQ